MSWTQKKPKRQHIRVKDSRESTQQVEGCVQPMEMLILEATDHWYGEIQGTCVSFERRVEWRGREVQPTSVTMLWLKCSTFRTCLAKLRFLLKRLRFQFLRRSGFSMELKPFWKKVWQNNSTLIFFNGLKMSNDQYTLSLTCLAKQLHLCLRKIHAPAPPGVPSDAIASLLRKN